MAHEVVWLRAALNDLDAIGEYIAASSPRYASIVVSRLIAASRDLSRFPLMGSPVPEWEADEFRQRIVYNYRLIYRVKGSRVEILAVLHGARQLPEEYKERA